MNSPIGPSSIYQLANNNKVNNPPNYLLNSITKIYSEFCEIVKNIINHQLIPSQKEFTNLWNKNRQISEHDLIDNCSRLRVYGQHKNIVLGSNMLGIITHIYNLLFCKYHPEEQMDTSMEASYVNLFVYMMDRTGMSLLGYQRYFPYQQFQFYSTLGRKIEIADLINECQYNEIYIKGFNSLINYICQEKNEKKIYSSLDELLENTK